MIGNQGLFDALETKIESLPTSRLKLLKYGDQRVEWFSSEANLVVYLQQANREDDWLLYQRIESENQRRRTATALAIKQYQLEKGQWPSGLDSLNKVGLLPGDFTMVQGHRLGFQVDRLAEQEREQAAADLQNEEFALVWFPIWPRPSKERDKIAPPSTIKSLSQEGLFLDRETLVLRIR